MSLFEVQSYIKMKKMGHSEKVGLCFLLPPKENVSKITVFTAEIFDFLRKPVSEIIIFFPDKNRLTVKNKTKK